MDHMICIVRRTGPAVQVAQADASHVYPARDKNLDDRQLHTLMAKASGWDLGLVKVRALQQAYGSLAV